MSVPSSRLIFGLLPWYSVLITLGAALAVFLADREAKRLSLPADTVIDLALWTLPVGILGARLYFVAFSWPLFRDHPLSVLAIWEGGLAIYGGLIAGALVIFIFCRRRKLSVLLMLDVIAPGVALAQSIGRWGNYFNQEAYGLPVSASFLRFFPLAVQIPEGNTLVWHAATFFYESVLDLCIFFFLLRGRRRLFRREGDVIFFYGFLYASGRLWIEHLRMDSLVFSGSVRVSQLLSVLICLAGVCDLILRKKKEGKKLPAAALFLLFPFSLLGAGTMLLCLGWCPPPLADVRAQLILLACFSLCAVLTARMLYGSGDISEVRYANHQSA